MEKKRHLPNTSYRKFVKRMLSCYVMSKSAVLWNIALQVFSVHGIFQVRTLDWVAISSSRGSSQPRDGIHVFCVSCIAMQISLTLSHLGSPIT